jgi:DNA-binding response OmpR family regulator
MNTNMNATLADEPTTADSFVNNPQSAAPRRYPASAAKAAAPMKPRHILLADDDPSVREMLGRVLESEHYQVSFAKNGREATQRLKADPPDLILLDLSMPEKDGWETFNGICDTQPMVPVIIITARPHQYGRALDLGVDALMEKPLHLPLLLKTIDSLLNETEAERVERLTNPAFKTAFLSQQPPFAVREVSHEE